MQAVEIVLEIFYVSFAVVDDEVEVTYLLLKIYRGLQDIVLQFCKFALRAREGIVFQSADMLKLVNPQSDIIQLNAFRKLLIPELFLLTDY